MTKISGDITFNIMNWQKVGKLEKKLLELLRKSAITTSDLESFARSIGRRKLKGGQVRGKEPVWVSDEFPEARPISIPFHGRNRNFSIGTAKSILNDFDEDIKKLKLKYPKDKELNNEIQEYDEYEN